MSGNGKQPSQHDVDETARLARWDAEIEAEFQRVVASTKAAGRAKRGRRLVAFPWAYLRDVYRSVDGRAAVVVAMVIYRRIHVCKNRTVTLPGSELEELGMSRKLKQRALARLETAGLIRVEKSAPGRAVKVTLLWNK
jgi:hypothetical protein